MHTIRQQLRRAYEWASGNFDDYSHYGYLMSWAGLLMLALYDVTEGSLV